MADKKKLLIVEDEPDLVKWLTIFFQENGYDVVTAGDGIVGFEMALKEQPDLITLDISMPKESGVKMYKRLHDSEKTANIPVVMITGAPPDLERFFSKTKQVNRPAGYFTKPVERDALLATVRKLIG